MHELVEFMLELVHDPRRLLAFQENPAKFMQNAGVTEEYCAVIARRQKREIDATLGGGSLDI